MDRHRQPSERRPFALDRHVGNHPSAGDKSEGAVQHDPKEHRERPQRIEIVTPSDACRESLRIRRVAPM